MSQNTNIALEAIAYTRTDFTALRAWILRIEPAQIARLYYADDAPQLKGGLLTFLTNMRADLIERAIAANPAAATALANARQGGAMSEKALAEVIKMGDVRPALPKNSDLIATWLRPKTASTLIGHGLKTIEDLIDVISTRGNRWYSPIPRLGEKKSKAIERWLDHHGTLKKIDRTSQLPSVVGGKTVEIDPSNRQILPLERITLPSKYDGSYGSNRAPAFPFISARNDLEAVRAYLVMHRNSPKTERVYQKELERFLLWCVLVAKRPLSSVLVDDCEAYKDFLMDPLPEFCGTKALRMSKGWRPFSTKPLSPKSQKYAVQVIRTFFDWLIDVRYLAGNPWKAVKDPVTETAEYAMQIDKALPKELWIKFKEELDAFCAPDEATQLRIARCAILLLGEAGMRRAEVALAQRENLTPSSFGQVYELRVLGKRNKWRTVPVSNKTVAAIKAHYLDRNQSFDVDIQAPLLSPLASLQTIQNIKKHSVSLERMPYSGDGIYKLVNRTIEIVAQSLVFTKEERRALLAASSHDFRHTFATQAIAKGMPVDVAQKILGHASVATTSIYVQAEKQRIVEEASKYFEE